MNHSDVLVSVIIPCYNKERYIERTLASVLEQTYANFEVVVVDDCSTDQSWRVVQSFVEKDSRFKAERNKVNKGGDYCRNRGFTLSKGEYVIFLDGDDWLAKDCIADRLAEMEAEENSKYDMIVFPSISYKGGRLFNYVALRNEKDALVGFLRQDSPWQTMMPIWRREAFARLGGFDEDFPRLQDVEMFSRALIEGVHYKASRKSEHDCYYCDEDARLMNFEKMANKATSSMIMFLDKMRSLVRTKKQRAALAETEMVAIRTVGDIYQMRGIAKELRDDLYGRILGLSNVSRWTKFYAVCYRLRINKVRGFNYLFVRIYRFLTY